MTDSYAQQKQLESLVSNDLTPQMSTIDILSSLKLIGHWENPDNANTVAGKIAQKELEYLKLGFTAVQQNPALSQKFGNNFQGGLAVSQLLKTAQAERIYTKLIGQVLDSNKDMEITTAITRLNGGGSAISGTPS